MTVISSKEFVTNQEKYFNLALYEQVIIQKGDNMFIVQNFVPTNFSSESRYGWADAAKEFVESGDEESFFPDFFKDEDLNWWQWEQ